MVTFLIVPGSFAPSAPSPYRDLLAPALAAHGHGAVVVDLPSEARAAREPAGLPAASMNDDADAVAAAGEAALAAAGNDDDGELVLLTHSYGGVPGTQSLQRLAAAARARQGRAGGIRRVVYVASLVPPVGTAVVDLFGGKMPDSITSVGDYMSLDVDHVAATSFSDLPTEEALTWARRMVDHSTAAFQEPLAYGGYNDMDEVHYIVCTEDRTIPPPAQYGMIAGVKASRGGEVNVHEFNSGHTPIVSQPENLAKLLADIVKRV